MSVKIVKASKPEHFSAAITLFKEYADEEGFDLAYQNFEEELKTMDKQYGFPNGALFLLEQNDEFLGCIGVRKLEGIICELKRMYIKPEGRSKGMGKSLLLQGIEAAKDLGYDKMRLDTLSRMEKAIHLYKSQGFYEIEPYRFNPFDTALFLELDLKKSL